MNDMTPITDPRSTTPHYFIVAGISLTSIRKVLKPALPKKRQESSYLVVITTTAICATRTARSEPTWVWTRTARASNYSTRTAEFCENCHEDRRDRMGFPVWKPKRGQRQSRGEEVLP
jgi:hypothetical protein